MCLFGQHEKKSENRVFHTERLFFFPSVHLDILNHIVLESSIVAQEHRPTFSYMTFLSRNSDNIVESGDPGEVMGV